MALEIKQREREGILILDLTGRITVGEEAGVLRAEFGTLTGAANVVLNLQHVSYIDSTGLGALVLGYTSLRKRGGRLILENLSRRNIELLLFTKLTTVFELFNDEQDAVNSFFPDREIRRFDILDFVKEQTSQEGM
ncbi:MAG TPA: STAS domain-containing protein [Bryobacteraceae bacterium]|jgi:anti-sigma B factor antagonist|nr:STAS domain-containing protein [Bryobacteraceae bacterium]